MTTATLQELVGQPWAVMSRLVENLVWSLGTAAHFRRVISSCVQNGVDAGVFRQGLHDLTGLWV